MSNEKIPLVNQLHRPDGKVVVHRRVIAKGLDDLWLADLVDMEAYSRLNEGYKYIPTIIDILSKYDWAIPVLTKSGKRVTQAFQKVLKEGRVPKNLQTDDGKQFHNSELKKLMSKHNIDHYSI